MSTIKKINEVVNYLDCITGPIPLHNAFAACCGAYAGQIFSIPTGVGLCIVDTPVELESVPKGNSYFTEDVFIPIKVADKDKYLFFRLTHSNPEFTIEHPGNTLLLTQKENFPDNVVSTTLNPAATYLYRCNNTVHGLKTELTEEEKQYRDKKYLSIFKDKYVIAISQDFPKEYIDTLDPSIRSYYSCDNYRRVLDVLKPGLIYQSDRFFNQTHAEYRYDYLRLHVYKF